MIKTVKEFMEGEEKVTDLNNPNCSNCNECCGLMTMITLEEYDFYIKYFKKSKNYKLLKDAATRHIALGDKYNSYNMMCPFSSKNKRCLIYNIRPAACREFHCKSDLNLLDKNKIANIDHKTMFDIFITML